LVVKDINLPLFLYNDTINNLTEEEKKNVIKDIETEICEISQVNNIPFVIK
jgi:hypothetical protein